MEIKTSRIEGVDSLRGFAVFGILLSHCYYLFFLGDPIHSTMADEGVKMVVTLFVNDKFYSLFSFLFGLSFSLMLSRTNEPPGKFYLRFAWRLILLGAIGILHNLHWNDDILSIYAFLGFILLPVSKLSNKVVFLIAILFLINLPSVFINLLQQPRSKEIIELEKQAAKKTYSEFFAAMKQGTYLDTVKANISTYPYKFQYYLHSGRFSFMLGFFFLGLISGRKKLFQNFSEHKKLFKKVFLWTGIFSLLATAMVLGFMLGEAKLSPAANSYLKLIMKMQSIFLTIAYASGMTLIFMGSSLNWVSKKFALIGKMALTNYVLHSVLGTLLLCGYGFGLVNQPISITGATLACFPIFISMILFSQFWLSRFSYGPLEWIWRSATYFILFPIRRLKN